MSKGRSSEKDPPTELEGKPDGEKKEDLEDDLFGPKSTSSLEFWIKMENTTAGTSVSDARRIKIIQILDKGLILETPEKSSAPGHSVSFDIRCTGTKKLKLDFHVTAKVESLKAFPEDHVDQITVRLLQYPEAPWDAMNKVFADRQKEIMDFLAAAGGRG